jgi:predicted nucleic acid-binding protein
VILVDTSVWVEHLRRGSQELEALLVEGEVMCHQFVIGELACGNLKNRSAILGLLHEHNGHIGGSRRSSESCG